MSARKPRLSRSVLLALGLALMTVATASADVTVTNQSNSELFVSSGFHVNGRVVYSGWHRIANGGSEKVYFGNEPKIMLCVFKWQNGQRFFYRNISGNNGVVNNVVSADGFRMEHQGGPANIWKMTDITQNRVYFKDNNNRWDPSLNLFDAPFWIVSGTQNQNFIP